MLADLAQHNGLLIAGLGAWLLLRRLSGGPDHVHIGGHDHHHHHHGADHYHDEQGHAHPLPPAPQGVWGLIVLGISVGAFIVQMKFHGDLVHVCVFASLALYLLWAQRRSLQARLGYVGVLSGG